ncbi:MAG TPA: LytTR family DNA-binding domain-containing protein [Salinimicrobium sp.]|nr:LytTR family DNA-binding domain-containing protein [Salinimicrobium sp.]
MKVIIIEDEKPSARRLKRMLEKQQLEVVQLLHSVKGAISWFEIHEQPDLIFLDIQLSDGLSFEIFEETPVNSAIIFTTAYDEYALKAFKLNSVDYLLKPIDEEELAQAIKKYQKHQNPKNIDLGELHQLLNGNEKKKHYKNRFSVKVGQHLKFFNTDEIECFYSENKATCLHTSLNRSYVMEISLENLEKELDPEVFFRVNRKFFINLNAIHDIVNYTNSRLKIKLNHYNEHEIIVSRERVKDFKRWIG